MGFDFLFAHNWHNRIRETWVLYDAEPDDYTILVDRATGININGIKTPKTFGVVQGDIAYVYNDEIIAVCFKGYRKRCLTIQ
jgi:hypothetical protein